jgi:hypothetical protein
MPGKDDKQYNDALGSIYDFLFEQAEKPIDKRKPIKPSGLSGGSEFADALGTVVLNPAAYVGTATMDTISEAYNADLVEFEIDKQGSKVEIKLNDIGKMLKNPNKFFDDQYKKAEAIRKAGRVRWFSRPIQQQVFTAWARKNGFTMEEARVLGETVGSGLADEGFKAHFWDQGYDKVTGKKDAKKPGYDVSLSLKKGYDIRDVMYLRTFTGALTKEEALKAFEKGWSRSGLATSQRKTYLRDLLQQEVDRRGGLSKEQLGEFLASKGFVPNSAVYKNIVSSYGFQDKPENHRGIVSNYFRSRAEQAEANGDVAGRDRYGRAVNIIDKIGNDNLLRETRIGINKLEEAVNNIPRANRNANNNTFVTLSEQLKKLKRTEVDLKTGLGGSMFTYDLFSNLGKIEGFAASWKASYGISKDLIKGIFTGDFYDDRGHKNSLFSPSKKGYKVGTSKGVFEVHMAKSAGVPYSPELAEMLNTVYYFTPAGIVSTLSSGEGFAFMIHKGRTKLLQTLKSLSGNDRALIIQLGINPGALGDDLKFLNPILNDTNKLDALINYFNSNPNSPLANKLLPILNRDKRLLKLADNFAWGTKFKNAIGMSVKNYLNKRLIGLGEGLDEAALRELGIINVVNRYIAAKVIASKLWRDGIEKYIVQKLGKEAAEAITKAMLKEGLRAAISGFFTAVGTSVGGPIGTALGWLATEVVMSIGYELIRVSFLLLFLIILGFIATTLTTFYGITTTVSNQYNIHTHVNPAEVLACAAYTPEGGLVPGTGPGGEAEYVPGNLPPGQECLFSGYNNTPTTFSCYQGPWDPRTHKYVNAIDLLANPSKDFIFGAPQFCNVSERNCKVAAVGYTYTCLGGTEAGGWVKIQATYQGRVYEFFVLHVAPDPQKPPGYILGPGEGVATVVHRGNWTCSGGLHAHVEAKVDGATVNPWNVLNQDFNCNISPCP